MKRLVAGSIPAEGSSSKIIGGFPTTAMATESFRLFPPDRVAAALSFSAIKPSCLMAFPTRKCLHYSGMPLMVAKYSMFYSTVSAGMIKCCYGQ